MKNKVLIPVGGFFPFQNYGGPSVSILNICNLLNKQVDFVIVTSNHEFNDRNNTIPLESKYYNEYNAFIYYLDEKERNFEHFLEIVKKEKPNLIYLNSLFDAKNTFNFLRIAKKLGIKVLLAPRGQLNRGAFKKKYKKMPYLWITKRLMHKSNVHFQSTCEEESDAIVKFLSKDKNKLHFLTNIPSIPVKQYDHYKTKGILNIVYFGRIHPKKNISFIFDVLSFISEGSINFDIFGPIENKDYWDDCVAKSKALSSNINVQYKGLIKHEDVFEVISQYDLFFFPTFSENYGHVIAESLGSGTPVLISDQTPWSFVNEFKSGGAYSLNDIGSFVSFLKNYLEMDNASFEEIRKKAVMAFNKSMNLEKIKEDYLDVFCAS